MQARSEAKKDGYTLRVGIITTIIRLTKKKKIPLKITLSKADIYIFPFPYHVRRTLELIGIIGFEAQFRKKRIILSKRTVLVD